MSDPNDWCQEFYDEGYERGEEWANGDDASIAQLRRLNRLYDELILDPNYFKFFEHEHAAADIARESMVQLRRRCLGKRLLARIIPTYGIPSSCRVLSKERWVQSGSRMTMRWSATTLPRPPSSRHSLPRRPRAMVANPRQRSPRIILVESNQRFLEGPDEPGPATGESLANRPSPPHVKLSGATPIGHDAEETMDAYLTATALAKKHNVPLAALKRRGERWRITNRDKAGSAFIESSDRRKGHEKRLYREAAVQHIISRLKELDKGRVSILRRERVLTPVTMV